MSKRKSTLIVLKEDSYIKDKPNQKNKSKNNNHQVLADCSNESHTRFNNSIINKKLKLGVKDLEDPCYRSSENLNSQDSDCYFNSQEYHQSVSDHFSQFSEDMIPDDLISESSDESFETEDKFGCIKCNSRSLDYLTEKRSKYVTNVYSATSNYVETLSGIDGRNNQATGNKIKCHHLNKNYLSVDSFFKVKDLLDPLSSQLDYSSGATVVKKSVSQKCFSADYFCKELFSKSSVEGESYSEQCNSPNINFDCWIQRSNSQQNVEANSLASSNAIESFHDMLRDKHTIDSEAFIKNHSNFEGTIIKHSNTKLSSNPQNTSMDDFLTEFCRKSPIKRTKNKYALVKVSDEHGSVGLKSLMDGLSSNPLLDKQGNSNEFLSDFFLEWPLPNESFDNSPQQETDISQESFIFKIDKNNQTCLGTNNCNAVPDITFKESNILKGSDFRLENVSDTNKVLNAEETLRNDEDNIDVLSETDTNIFKTVYNVCPNPTYFNFTSENIIVGNELPCNVSNNVLTPFNDSTTGSLIFENVLLPDSVDRKVMDLNVGIMTPTNQSVCETQHTPPILMNHDASKILEDEIEVDEECNYNIFKDNIGSVIFGLGNEDFPHDVNDIKPVLIDSDVPVSPDINLFNNTAFLEKSLPSVCHVNSDELNDVDLSIDINKLLAGNLSPPNHNYLYCSTPKHQNMFETASSFAIEESASVGKYIPKDFILDDNVLPLDINDFGADRINRGESGLLRFLNEIDDNFCVSLSQNQSNPLQRHGITICNEEPLLKTVDNNPFPVNNDCVEIWDTEICKKQTLIKRKIEWMFTDITKKLVQQRPLCFIVRSVSQWDNCVYEDGCLKLKPIGEARSRIIKFSSCSGLQYSTIIYLLGKIYSLLQSQCTCTQREIYYMIKDSVTNQNRIRRGMNTISTMFEIEPWYFPIVSTSKGLIFGDLEMKLEDDVLYCNLPGGILIPQDVIKIKQFKTNADFVLIVEKDAVFKKILDEDIPAKRKLPFLLITGKGYPDVNTRLLVRRLGDSLRIPVFILVDADPHGIDIMLTYRFGSLSLSHISDKLALPSMKWLGILPSEIMSLNVTRRTLSKKEVTMTNAMLKRPYIYDNIWLKKELETLLQNNVKADIEGVIKSNFYLTDFYLRNKFNTKDYF